MQIFTFCAVYNGNLHVFAKCCLDRLKGCGDIANFQFPVWAVARHLGFVIVKYANFNITRCL